jgi:hypothetical protein
LLKLVAGDSLQRTLGPERTLKSTERLRIGAPTRACEIGLGEERVDSVDEHRRLLSRRAQPVTGSPRRGHRRECVIFAGPGSGVSTDGY